jgi:hypothetical protein
MGAVDVTVTTGQGTSALTTADRFTYGDTLIRTSLAQYQLANSDGTLWRDLDPAGGLTLTLTPGVDSQAVLTGNADLWTANAGINQDIGIWVSPSSSVQHIVAWKESGGNAGTFSPNAAAVQTVYPMTAGVSYTVKLQWKANRPAPGATIFAAAGLGPSFSPTSLILHLVPNSAQNLTSQAALLQYTQSGSDGATWRDLDGSLLSLPFTPSVDGTALVTGNADLWTSSAGYNQDLGITVSGGAYPTKAGQPEAWKESGGFAGTFSPNAAFVETLVPLTHGSTYTMKLQWKSNKPDPGTIWTGAGLSPNFSPTRITVLFLPASTGIAQAVTTLQPTQTGSDGATWKPLGAGGLTLSFTSPASCLVSLSGNADLWTSSAGVNQDIGIAMSGGAYPSSAGQPEAWKESGGRAGTFSPNAAFVQALIPVSPGVTYTAQLVWKANVGGSGTIWSGAGPIGGPFSPTRLIAQIVSCS